MPTSDEITNLIIGAAIEVHRELGPGLLESVYEVCLAYEISRRGLKVSRQLRLPVTYRDLELDEGFRIDLLVDNEIVVELKATQKLTAVHQAQLLTYLRLSGKRVGLLLNFHEATLCKGLKRMVYDPRPPISQSL